MEKNSSTNGKAIKVNPDELIFDAICVNQQYTQQLILKNNLSAPVELTLKASNSERIEIDPKFKKLAPFESFTVDVTVKLIRALPNKTQKQKETIFIKSDFFDQKINVTLIPSVLASTTTPRETSIGSSIRVSNNQPFHSKNQSKYDQKHLKRDSMMEGGISGKQDFLSKEYSPSRVLAQTQTLELEKEIQDKNSEIQDLKIQVLQQKNEIQNVCAQLKGEQAKRKELEENSAGNTYNEYLEQVRQALKEREPNLEKLMDISLRKEREQQERKDAKILEILKIKDKQIEELQSRAVQQETEFGNLSSQFSEIKRSNLQLEEENQELIEKIRYYQSQCENALKKVQSYESGLDYKKIQEITNQLQESNQTIINMQDQLDLCEQTIQEKEHSQGILQEAIDRMREQIMNKNSQLQELENKVQDEIQRKISSEEHVKSLMQQINMMSQENLNERTFQMQQIKSDKDYIERIDKLQQEKYELINEIDNQRRQNIKDQEKGRFILERLSQVRGFGGTFGTNTNSLYNILEQIERKVEDVARVLKEMETDNLDINAQLKKANEKIMNQSEELSSLINENQLISSKIKTKKKSFGTQTKVDIHEMNDIVSNYDRVQQKCCDLEEQNQKMDQELVFIRQQLQQSQFELQKANQEINIVMKSHQLSQKRNSLSTSQSDFNHNNQYGSVVLAQSQDSEDIVSKLNAKISSLKVNEAKLLDQINFLKQNIKNQAALQQSEGGLTQSTKSTTGPADTDRFRNYAQQLEQNNQNLKETLDQVQNEKDQLSYDCKLLKDQIILQDRQLSRFKQLQQNSVEFSQNEIDNDSGQKTYTAHRIEDLAKNNDRLRKENQQSLLSVMDLKEEFANKIQYIGENYQQEIEKLKNQNQQIQRKVESLQSQIQYMEKKEIRLFGQLEEAKLLQQQETEEKERRTKELEEILFKKEETMNELEREIKQKERSLQERQEQIAVLIEALENENSQDQLRQKVLNLSAELCSLKAIEAQQEKKLNETVHLLKKSEMNSTRNTEQFNKKKAKNKELSQEIKRLEKDNDQQQKKIQDLQIDLEDKTRECNDNKYKLDREQFQLQLKEESIVQMRDQIRRQEINFREEVEKLRKDFSSKCVQSSNTTQYNTSTKSHSFKQQLAQLNLLLSEMIQQNQYQQNESILIQELERVINVSSQTIEQIQQELDNQKIVNCKLQNEYRALSLNKILLERYQALQKQTQQVKTLFEKRENERETYIKEKDAISQKLIREQDQRIKFIEKNNESLEETNSELTIKYKEQMEKKEELESQIICFQQELNNQKLAMEKKAELTVDERFKARYESIRTYFDSNITKLLLNQGGIDKALDLGREICSQKIVIEKLEQKLLSAQSDKDALEVNLYYYKESLTQQEQKFRELQVKLGLSQQKVKQQDLKVKMEMERKKNESLQQDKELLKLKEQLEDKAREILKLEQQIQQKVDIDQHQVNFDQVEQNDLKVQEQSEQIQQLQEKLLEIRSQHIQELEELKLQYDLEVSQAKKEIFNQRQVLEKRYLPGNAPGDIVEQNQILRQKIDEFKIIVERVTQENVILRKKIEQEKYNSENQKGYLQAHKQALADLETTLMEISQSQTQNQISQYQNNNTQFQNFSKQQPEEKKRKSIKVKQQKNLHFKKDQSDNDNRDTLIQQSHSKINYADSSLDCSVFTTQQLQRPSNISQSTKQFMINPPQLVKALVQSKINEMLFKKRVEELTQNEQIIREQFKKQINEQYTSNNTSNDQDIELAEYKKRIIELEIDNEDLKIQRAQSHVELGKTLIEHTQSFIQDKQEPVQQDYNILIQSILALVNQIASLENQQMNQQQDYSTEQAQRLVIKALVNSIRARSDKSGLDLEYQPSNDYDRKVWYLELLEQQLDNSENIVKNLQSFIKKLSIDIQGNLQSAAQIKAASMDLAQNTKQTAEEIASVRYIAGLIKQDLLNIKNNNINNNNTIQVQQQFQVQRTINPFTDNFSQNDQLYSNIEQLQNQLTITGKVKSTLEKDLVALRITQSQELQHLQQQYTLASEQRDQLIAQNEELSQKLINMDQKMQVMKDEISIIGQEREHNLTNLLDREREKDQLVKNKNATSKHLQKLQQDLNEWKKQADENLKTKEKQVQELGSQVSNLTIERDRLKAENGMLRSNAKELRKGESEEISRLEQEIVQLQDQLNEEIENRKKEIEYWVAERGTMREMIDQLENERVNNEQIIDIEKYETSKTGDQVQKLKKKNYKKLKQKEIEIKSRDKEVLDLKDQLSKVRLQATNLEKKVRELTSNYTEAEERVKYFSQKVKEAELEKELVLAEKNNAISSNDLTAQQISEELNSLRECFAKLKIERDNLLYEMELTRQKEKEWRLNVESLQQELQTMEKHLINREKEQGTTLKVMDSKCQAMIQDMKYLKTENERLKSRVKEQEGQVFDQERSTHQQEMRVQELKFQIEENMRKINDLEREVKSKDDQVKGIQMQLIENENAKYKDIEKLKQNLDQVKEANAQIVSLYENQLEVLKAKFMKEKGKSEQKTEQIFSLAQREAVIKNLKKDNQTFKSKVSKLQEKNKELKNQLKQNQENTAAQTNKKSIVIKKKQAAEPQKPQQPIMTEETYQQVMESFQSQNTLMSRITELECEYAKNEQWNIVLSQQLQQQQDANNQLQEQVEDLQKKEVKESKMFKQSQNHSDISKQQKQEIKQLTIEISNLKSEWMSPEEKQYLVEQIKELQGQIKSLKDEVSRKREVINTMKLQRDQTEVEANQIIQDMEGLKDDNVKLQKLAKENNKNVTMIKDLKGTNEYLKTQEKKLKEEITSLNEKCKALKTDNQRKEQIIRDYRDKLDSVQDDFNSAKERYNEIERLKEQIKKYKLDIEIKEGQIKALKQRIETREEELEQAKLSQSSNIQASQISQQIDSQLKSSRLKVKKYEGYLKKSLDTIRKIGRELAQTNEKLQKEQNKKKNYSKEKQNAMQMSELDRELYKDSVNILGVSIDELEEFMNPSVSSVPKKINQSKSENSVLLAKLENALAIPESLNQDLEQICNQCVKLINDMNPDMQYL